MKKKLLCFAAILTLSLLPNCGMRINGLPDNGQLKDQEKPHFAPAAQADNYLISTNSYFSANAPGVLENDVSRDTYPMNAQLVAVPSNGVLSLNPNGSFNYTPKTGFTGTDGFTYQATSSGLTPSQTVSVTLTISTTPPTSSKSSLIFAKVATSGKSIVLLCGDQFGHPSNVTAIATAPTISINQGAASALTNPIWGVTTNGALPYVIYPLSNLVLKSSDVVTISAPAGWATCKTGPLPALQTTLVNSVDIPLTPAVTTNGKIMPVGYNVPAPNYYSTQMFYTNSFLQSSGWSSDWPGTTVYTQDGEGNLVTMSGGTVGNIVSAGTVNNGTTISGYPVSPPGVWTLMWDGPGTVIFRGIAPLAQSLTGRNDNVAQYRITTSTNAYYVGVFISVTVPGVRNIRVYSPGVPTDQKFHPELIRMLSGARSIRFMDTLRTNSSNIVTFADLTLPTFIRFGGEVVRRTVANIVSIGPYDNGNGAYFYSNGRAYLLVTTDAAHGFVTGQTVTFANMGGSLRFVNGNTALINGLWGAVLVLSPTTFAIDLWNTSGSPLAATQTITGTATVTIGSQVPLADLIELANTANADPWINVPHLLGTTDGDQSVTEMAETVVKNLAPGRKVYVEYSNETWNIAPGFNQGMYVKGQSAQAGLSASAWYAMRSAQVHKRFEEVFTNAGRPGDLIRVFASQAGWVGNGSPVAQILTYAKANNIPVDVLATAPYFDVGPSDISLASIYDTLDVDQLEDLSEMFVTYSPFSTATHASLLKAAYPKAKMVFYEGGMESGVPRGTVTLGARSRAWARHPRIKNTQWEYLQRHQDQGGSLFNIYTLTMPVGGTDINMMWPVYIAWNQRDGVGDGSDRQFDNRQNYDDLNHIVSVIGYALKQWNSWIKP